MDVSVSSVFKQFKDFYKKLGKKKRVVIYTTITFIIALAFVISIVTNSGKYTELYTGLSSTEAAEIYSALKNMAVDVKVKDENTILVPKSQVATLKMELAVQGYPKSALGYDMLTEGSSIFTTDYEKRQLLIFQLQDRIQASIETLQGVNSAIVTLSIPEDNSYVLADEKVSATASVIIDLKANSELSQSQINGIENLVASGVSGLTSDNVVITNGDGVQLNDDDTQSGMDSAYYRVETINAINELYEEKIKDLLSPILGENGMSVAVNVLVDFNIVTSEKTEFSPVIDDKGIVSSVEESSAETNETSGNSDVAGTGSNTDTTTYAETDTPDTETTDSSSSYSAEYLVNQLIEAVQDNGGDITDISVALVINTEKLANDEITKYKELVAASMGISTDKVVVLSAEFLAEEEKPVVSDNSSSFDTSLLSLHLSDNNIIIIFAAAVGFLFVFFVILAVNRKKKRKKEDDEQLADDEKLTDDERLAELFGKKMRKKEMPGEIVVNETREQALKRQIKEFSQGNPEVVAQLLRVWVKEDDNN